MLRSLCLAILLSFCALDLAAQQPQTLNAPARDPFQPQTNLTPSTLDRAEYVASVRDSYYHPDELSGLDCKVAVDWAALFTALKTNVPAERMKALQSLTIQVKAPRNKTPEITFDWGGATIVTKQQMESGLKQMIGGFYQMYWPIIASFPIKGASEIQKIEPLADGGGKIHLQNQGTSAVFITDRQHTLTQFSFESPAMKGTADLGYSPSPNPVPGDLRRLTSAKVTDHFGTSTINLNLGLDYQSVGGFLIPQHVTFDMGTYAIKMEFSGCAVSREITLSPEPGVTKSATPPTL